MLDINNEENEKRPKFGRYGTAAETEYTEIEEIINGQKIIVKVYPSSADKIIKEMRERNEAAPAIKKRK